MHNDNEKPFRNHIEDIPTKKVSTTTLFSHGFDLLASCGKNFKKYGNNKFHFIRNCLIVLQLKDDRIKHARNRTTKK